MSALARLPAAPTAPAARTTLRRCGSHSCPPNGCSEEREALRTASGPGPARAPSIVEEVLRGPGHPLHSATRALMEPALGHDFSHVRIHDDVRSGASALSVQAHAYTVGSDVVFAPGRYAPGSAEGRRLLAHELVHVAQQGNTPVAGPITVGDPHAPEEHQARSAALGFRTRIAGRDRGAAVLRRDDGAPGPAPPEDEETRAARAEVACDLGELCRIHRASPSVVDDDRVRATFTRCFPHAGLTASPCLSIYTLPQYRPGARAAGAGPATAPVSPGAAPSGGLGLDTTFSFNVGPVRTTVTLPSSVKASLPVPLGRARSIEFSLEGGVSGTFSFGIRLDGIPHVRIGARAAADVTTGVGRAGLTVSTTRTVCQAADPEAVRKEIVDAGGKLQKAINEWQTPPPAAPGTTPPTTTKRLVEIGSNIADLYKAVEKAKKPCEQVPVVTFEVGAQTPLFEGPSAAPGAPPPPSSIGATLTVRF